MVDQFELLPFDTLNQYYTQLKNQKFTKIVKTYNVDSLGNKHYLGKAKEINTWEDIVFFHYPQMYGQVHFNNGQIERSLTDELTDSIAFELGLKVRYFPSNGKNLYKEVDVEDLR